MYKPLSDSTLMSMTKKQIIEYLRIAEHNERVTQEQIEQQYKNVLNNFIYIKELQEKIEEYRSGFYGSEFATDIFNKTIDDVLLIIEQLKEKKDEKNRIV